MGNNSLTTLKLRTVYTGKWMLDPSFAVFGICFATLQNENHVKTLELMWKCQVDRVGHANNSRKPLYSQVYSIFKVCCSVFM